MNKFKLSIFLLLFLLFFVSFSVIAQDYPLKPIKSLIPLSAGGTSDIVARALAPYMEEYLGQPLVLINKPGANGTLAVAEVAQSEPDGYTFGWANLPTLVIHSQLTELPYDPEELEFIATAMPFEYVVLVRKDASWNTWEEFIQYAKSNPGKITYGVPGLGSTNHLALEFVAMKENIQWEPVPFPGNPEAIAAVLGGHVNACNTSTTAAVSTVQSGEMKPLIVLSDKRINLIPDIPTILEKGYDFYQYSCLGAVLPPNTPEAIRLKLEQAIEYACNQDDIQEKAKNNFFVTIDFKNGSEYRELATKYYKIWGDVLRQVGLLK
ncbi:MAG: tripartite tricarboxylate transporter substrate binding protein [Candidatus Atribacteria bacterium]|nr:tripartite tricarboxylate transporter substrate binding protein [Candidatus Atribacteria bacterium]